MPADLAAWREWLAGHDAAGVILPPGIKFISANVQNGLQTMRDNMGDMKVQSLASVFLLYEKVLQSAERELAGWGFGVDLDKSNSITVTDRAAAGPWRRMGRIRQ